MESSFAGLTSQIQKYSRIGIPGAAAITDAKRNKFFENCFLKKCSRSHPAMRPYVKLKKFPKIASLWLLTSDCLFKNFQLLDGRFMNTKCLWKILEVWGNPGLLSGSSDNPGFLYDTFARVGGDTSSTEDNCQR